MATNGGRINFEVGFVTDAHGLNDLKKQLNEIRKMASSDAMIGNGAEEIQQMTKAANDLEHAMNAAFDVDLNTVNIQKFQQILKQSGTSLADIQKGLAQAGAVGQGAFLKATAGLMQFNTVAKKTNQFLDKIATSLTNTIRWTAMSSIVNRISGTIQKSYYYVKDLDSALNDIRIVTGKSADEMDRFAVKANNAAKQLAVTTEEYTKGALIFYQQGLDDTTVQALTDITAKTANVTGQSMAAVSEELTAVWNGYQVANQAAQEGMQVYEEYVDKMAAVGASTASNLEELSSAMSKVASAASAMGVGFDDLNAQIATIVSVTRQAPESVGTALKTIYARLGDLKIDGVDEFGTKLGEVSGQLDAVGIHILDTNGQMRDMSSVIQEVADKWSTWTQAQREAVAIVMAGKRQYNNLLALFNNWDMHDKALETSMGAIGTLAKQQDTALDSLQKRTKQLQASSEALYKSLYSETNLKGLVSSLTKIVDALTNFSSSIGGLHNLLPMLGATALRVFDNQIANGLLTVAENFKNVNNNEQVLEDNFARLQAMFSDSSLYTDIGPMTNIDPEVIKQGKEALEGYYKQMFQYRDLMTNEQRETHKYLLNEIASVGELNIQINESTNILNKNRKEWELINTDVLKSEDGLEKFKKQIADTEAIVQKIEEGFNFFDRKDISGADLAKQINIDEFIEKSGIAKEETEDLVKAFKGLGDSVGIELFIRQLKEGSIEAQELADKLQKVNYKQKDIDRTSSSMQVKLIDQQTVSELNNAIGAVGQLTTSMRTLGNLVNVIFNDNLDSGEKALQIIMNLSFAVPTLVRSLTTLGGVIKANNLLTVAGNAADEANLLISGRLTKKKVEQAVVSRIFMNLTKEEIASIAGETVAEELNVAALDADTRAKIINAKATVEEKAAVDAATASTLEWTLALMTNPIVAVTAAVIALTAALYLYNKAQEKIREKENEIAQQHIDKENQLQEEIKSHQEAYNSYMQLYNAYKEGKATKDEMKEATDNLTEAYGKEIDALGLLADNYQAVADSIKAKREEEINEGIESAKREKSSAEVQVSNAARSNATGIKSIHLDSGATTKDDEAVVSAFNNAVGSEVLKKGAFGYEYDIALNFSNPEQIVGVYDNLSQVVSHIEETLDPEEYLNSEIYMQAKEWIDSMTESVEALKQAEEDLEEYNAELTTLHIDYSDVDNLDAYNQALETTKAAIAKETDLELGKDDERLTALAQKYMEMQNASLSLFRQQQVAIEQLKESGNWLFTDEGYEKLFSKYSAEEISLVANFDIDEKVTEANFDEYLQKAKEKYAEEIITVSFDAATDMQNKIRSGDLTAENAEEDESFKTLTQNLDALTAAYPELTAEAELLNHTWLIGTQEYSEALEVIQDKLYELDLQKSYDKVNQMIDDFKEIQVDADTSKFTEEMEKILQAEYEIDVKIHAEAENEFNSIEQAFNDIHDKAELIGDDFKVSANNLRELNNAFPGILEGMTVLGDGTVQLNEKIVNSAMAAAEAEAQADAEATYTKLKDQAKLLRAKQATYQSMAEIALELANTEVDNEDKATQLRGELSDQLTYLKELNSADVANAEQTNDAAVADSANINAKQVADNWRSAFQVMANSSLAAAEAAIKNMNAVASRGATGTSGEVDLNDYQYTGGGGTTGESKIVEQVQNIIEGNSEEQQKNAAKLAEQLFAMADSTGKAANDIEGMIAQIGARGFKLDKELGGVASGLGSDGKKDKSKSGSKKEYKEDEVDRYWEINKALDAIERTLKKIQKVEEHVFGKQKIQVINNEIKALERQTEQYQILYQEQLKEAEELRKKLTAGGMTFSAEGEITNYGAALTQALQTYNAAVDQFNAGLIDEEAFKVAEKHYEDFQKDVKRYDTLFYNEIKNTLEKIEEQEQILRDKRLQVWEINLEVKLEKEKLKREFRDFARELSKDFTKNFEIIPKVKEYKPDFKSQKKTVKIDMKAISDVEAEIDKMMAGGSSTMFASVSEAQEKLKELKDSLFDDALAAKQIYEDAYNSFLERIDQTNEKIEQQYEEYERVNSQLEYQKQLIELIYGDKAYDQMETYYKQAEYNNLSQIQSTKKVADNYKSLFEDALEKEGANRDDMSTWSKELTKYYELWQNNQEKLNNLVINQINLLKEDYMNSVDGVLDEFEKKILKGTGVDSFEEMDKDWEHATELADMFYSSVEKSYNIQTLSNKIQKEINNQSSIKAQQKLEKLRKTELEQLGKKQYMTEYDLKAAEARYNIALKEIALEDAKNNKSSMKLTRNSEGNWSYQYVADEGDVAAKQQEYLDALMEFYNISSQAADNAMENVQKYEKAFTEEARLYAEKAQKEGWSEEQLKDKLKVLEEKYYGPTGYITLTQQQFKTAKEDMAKAGLAVQVEVYNEDKDEFIKLTDKQKDLIKGVKDKGIEDFAAFETAYDGNLDGMKNKMEEILTGEDGMEPTWQSAAYQMADDWNADEGKSVKNDVQAAINTIVTKSFKEYKDGMAEVEKASGQDWSKIQEAIKDTGTETDNAKKSITKYVKESKELEKEKTRIEGLKSAWENLASSVEGATGKLAEYLQKQQEIANTPIPSTATGGGSYSSGSSYGGGSGSGSTTPGGYITPPGSNPQGSTRTGAAIYLYRVSSGNYRKLVQGNYGYLTDSGEERPLSGWASAYPSNRFFAASPGSKTTDAVRIPGYKSGGYTGSWSGSDGRLAELHQKELVLNAQDTENMLSAVNTIRDLASLNSSIEKAITDSIAKMLTNMNVNNVKNIQNNSNETSSNNTFNITAEFPNANNVDDIRSAILSLPNMAAQYMGQRR